jgi:hypothetical protein
MSPKKKPGPKPKQRIEPNGESKDQAVESKTQKKREASSAPVRFVIDVASDDSGDHTCDEELATDEDSAGSLVDFVVDDDAALEEEKEEEENLVDHVEMVESAVYENGVRRSTRNRKPVERYVDSDYEDLMCADADPQAALEDSEDEVEGTESTATATEDEESTSETVSDSDS